MFRAPAAWHFLASLNSRQRRCRSPPCSQHLRVAAHASESLVCPVIELRMRHPLQCCIGWRNVWQFGAMPKNLPASLSGLTDISIFSARILQKGVSVWHCLQVFARASLQPRRCARSPTARSEVTNRRGQRALPVRSRLGSRCTRTSAGRAAMYSRNVLTRNACMTSGLSCGVPLSKRLSNVSRWHAAQAFANFTGAINSRPVTEREVLKVPE